MKNKERFNQLEKEIEQLEQAISEKRTELFDLYDPEDYAAIMDGKDHDEQDFDYLKTDIFPDNE